MDEREIIIDFLGFEEIKSNLVKLEIDRMIDLIQQEAIGKN